MPPLPPALPRRHLALLGLVLPGFLLARRAAAHAVVIAADPAAGARLTTPPTRVTIRFNSRIDQGRSRLTLVGPDGTATGLDLLPPLDPTTLAAELPNGPSPGSSPGSSTGSSPGPSIAPSPGPAPGRITWAPGAWRLRWQVLAIDGHITRGDIPFTLLPS